MGNNAEILSVRLPREVRERLDELARLTKRSRSFLIKEAVAAYMRDNAQFARELDEAVRSAESGYGHSAEQIFEWTRSWGTAQEKPSPNPDISPKN